MSKILMGSQYFFSCYEDFSSKDIDEIELVESPTFQWHRQLTGQGKCLFQFRKLNCADDYISYAVQCKLGMVIGKFLIPEFCDAIGMTIEDLPKLQPLIERLDDNHKYEEITISQVCKQAGVNRSTFYCHYDDINDLIIKIENKFYLDVYKDREGIWIINVINVAASKENHIHVDNLTLLNNDSDFSEIIIEKN